MSTMADLIRLRKVRGVTVPCANCGEPVRRLAWELRSGRAVFCGKACADHTVGSAIAEQWQRSFQDRFWQRVDKAGPVIYREIGPCWIWTGQRNNYGYGVVAKDRQSFLAHRVSFAQTATIPEGLYVLHHCDNPPCVRPDHLFTGTALTNTRDMVIKGRNRLPYANMNRKHPNAKLTDESVDTIIKLYNSTPRVTQVQLAASFGVGQSQISRIIRKESWRWKRSA